MQEGTTDSFIRGKRQTSTVLEPTAIQCAKPTGTLNKRRNSNSGQKNKRTRGKNDKEPSIKETQGEGRGRGEFD